MFYDTFKQLCERRGISCNKAAIEMGLSNATPTKWKKTGATPNVETLQMIADYFGIAVSSLLGESLPTIFDIPGVQPLPKTYSVPLLGEIACGDPILAEQNIADIITVPDAVKGADFALTCKGDSMINARIFDGDIVYIHMQETVENGEIAAVLIDDEATLKRVYHSPGRLTLRPCNPMYPDFEFSGEDLNKIRILGKAIAFTSLVR